MLEEETLCPQSLQNASSSISSDSCRRTCPGELVREEAQAPRACPPPPPRWPRYCCACLTSRPGACCFSSQSLKGAVGATFVLSGARSALSHFPASSGCLMRGSDVGPGRHREIKQAPVLSAAACTPSPARLNSLSVWGGAGGLWAPRSALSQKHSDWPCTAYAH